MHCCLPACLQVQRSCQGSPVPQVLPPPPLLPPPRLPASLYACCLASVARTQQQLLHRRPPPHAGRLTGQATGFLYRTRARVFQFAEETEMTKVSGWAGGWVGGRAGGALAWRAPAPASGDPGAFPPFKNTWRLSLPWPLCLCCPPLPLPCAAAPGGSGHHAPAARHPQRAAGGHQHLPPTRVSSFSRWSRWERASVYSRGWGSWAVEETGICVCNRCSGAACCCASQMRTSCTQPTGCVSVAMRLPAGL